MISSIEINVYVQFQYLTSDPGNRGVCNVKVFVSILVYISSLLSTKFDMQHEHIQKGFFYLLSYNFASGSEITPCNKIGKTLVVYRFSGNVMASITTLRT